MAPEGPADIVFVTSSHPGVFVSVCIKLSCRLASVKLHGDPNALCDEVANKIHLLHTGAGHN